MAAVNKWIASGHPPPQSPRLEVNKSNQHAFLTDANGNALGGIRTPQVQAPVAKLSGLGQPGSSSPPPSRPGTTQTVSGGALCGIFGTTVPFSSAALAKLYANHAAFVQKWDAATAAEVKAGYLLPAGPKMPNRAKSWTRSARTLDKVAAQSNVAG